MHKLSQIMIATNTIFIDWVHMTLIKFHVKFKPLPLKIFKLKVENVQKTHIPGVPKKITRLYNVISSRILNLTSSNFLQ